MTGGTATFEQTASKHSVDALALLRAGSIGGSLSGAGEILSARTIVLEGPTDRGKDGVDFVELDFVLILEHLAKDVLWLPGRV